MKIAAPNPVSALAEHPAASRSAAHSSAIPAAKLQPKSMATPALASSSGDPHSTAAASAARSGATFDTTRIAIAMPASVTRNEPRLTANGPPIPSKTALAASCSGNPQDRLRK